MIKTAYVFPGQGSQALGMGMDLLDIPIAQTKYKQAEGILGWSIIEVCQSHDDRINQTEFTQPCLYVIESILVDLLRERSHFPDMVAGHSLGEYSALYGAGVFSFEVGLDLVKYRSQLMSEATSGMMAALIGFDAAQLTDLIANTPEVVIANDNSSLQVVISGTPNGVEGVLSKVTAKRIVKLNVSGAFHSPLMSDAAQKFAEKLGTVGFNDAKIPVLCNVDPSPTQEAEVLKTRLVQQMTGQVRWREIALQFSNEKVTRMVEVGPGKVLTGLVKRISPEIELINIASKDELSSFTG